MAPRRPTLASIGKKPSPARSSFVRNPSPRVVVHRPQQAVYQQQAPNRPQAANAGGHTILLLQEAKNKATRTWTDHNTLTEVHAVARRCGCSPHCCLGRLPTFVHRVHHPVAPLTQQCLDTFVKTYETKLKALNPNAQQLTYTVMDLHTYIDEMADLSALVYSPAEKLYAPRGKDFLKKQLLLRLQAAAR